MGRKQSAVTSSTRTPPGYPRKSGSSVYPPSQPSQIVNQHRQQRKLLPVGVSWPPQAGQLARLSAGLSSIRASSAGDKGAQMSLACFAPTGSTPAELDGQV